MIRKVALVFAVVLSLFAVCSFCACSKEERKPGNFFIVLTDNFNHAYKIDQNIPYEESKAPDLIRHKNFFDYETEPGAMLVFQVYGPYNSDGTKMEEEFYQLVWNVEESSPIDLSEEGDYTISQSYYIRGINENGLSYHIYTAIFDFKIYVREAA